MRSAVVHFTAGVTESLLIRLLHPPGIPPSDVPVLHAGGAELVGPLAPSLRGVHPSPWESRAAFGRAEQRLDGGARIWRIGRHSVSFSLAVCRIACCEDVHIG